MEVSPLVVVPPDIRAPSAPSGCSSGLVERDSMGNNSSEVDILFDAVVAKFRVNQALFQDCFVFGKD